MNIKNRSFRLTCVIFSFSLSSLSAFAGPVVSGGGVGDRTQYLTCQSDEVQFLIQGTPVPSFKQGILRDLDGKVIAKFACKPNDTENVLWSCRQYPFQEENLLAQVELSRATGAKSAYVSQMQPSLSTPRALHTLNCN